MPTKPNKAGQQQNYVPQGNGDASGEYADNQTGSNVHFTNFKKPDTEKQIKIKEIVKSKTKKEQSSFNPLEIEEPKNEDLLIESLEEEEDLSLIGKDDDLPTFEEIVDEKLDNNETKEAILNLSPELDKEKVDNLDEKKAKKLLKAIETTENAQKKYDKLKKKFNDPKFEGIWKEEQTIPTLIEKYGNKEKVLESLELKKAWAQSNKPDLANQIENIDKELLKTQIDDYLSAKDKIDLKVQKAQKLIDQFQNPDSLYSKKRKNNAVWCKNIDEAKAKFPSIETKNITESEKEALEDYTSSYSSINEPLRGIHYVGGSQKKAAFIKQVEEMTKAIDKSTIDFDFWVQRGTSAVQFPNTKITYSSSKEELDKLVGTCFEDQAFVSTGAAKGTGFANSNIILNIYCPKGTKAAYVEPISHFKGENELLLQRGYSYRISKVEQKNGKIYMDCDLILDSDKNKYTKEQLKEIKEKYF